MSTTGTITYAAPQAAAPSLTVPGSADPRAAETNRILAVVPLALVVGIQLLFFVQYWLPETSRFPTRNWWLHELAPLASATLTSSGHPQVDAQYGPWGFTTALLLMASVGVFALCRSRRTWLGPWLMLIPWSLGLLAAMIVVSTLAITNSTGPSVLSVVLLVVWLAIAAVATLGKILNAPPPPVTKSWRSGGAVLFAYAIIGPLPTAVGRWLFAPDLRQVAAELQANTVALRLSALWTPVTGMFYLSGLAVGIAGWLTYQWWPPRKKVVAHSVAVFGMLVVIGLLGWPASTMATDRARLLAHESPATTNDFPCGSLILDEVQPRPVQPGPVRPGQDRPVMTMAFSGFSCKTVTTYVGYRQVATRDLPAKVSPMQARTPEGVKITGKYAAAQYGGIVVIAATSRLNSQPDRIFGISTLDGMQRWEFNCDNPARTNLLVRFARVPGGDDPALGHVTVSEKKPRVVVTCDGATQRFDPVKGPR